MSNGKNFFNIVPRQYPVLYILYIIRIVFVAHLCLCFTEEKKNNTKLTTFFRKTPLVFSSFFFCNLNLNGFQPGFKI